MVHTLWLRRPSKAEQKDQLVNLRVDLQLKIGSMSDHKNATARRFIQTSLLHLGTSLDIQHHKNATAPNVIHSLFDASLLQQIGAETALLVTLNRFESTYFFC